MLTRRQQTWGAVAVLAVAVFFAAGLPVISQAMTSDDLDPGAPIPVGDAMTIVPAAGWELSGSGPILVTLTQGPATLAVASAIPDTADPGTTLATDLESLDVDPSWVLGDETSFTTSAGYDAVTVAVYSSDEVAQIWVVSDGETSSTLLASAPADQWVSFQEELTEMVDSVRFVDQA